MQSYMRGDFDHDHADEPPYFWNYEFRFDLRNAPLAKRYEVLRRFHAAKLPLDGFTVEHLNTVDTVLEHRCIAWASPELPQELRHYTAA